MDESRLKNFILDSNQEKCYNEYNKMKEGKVMTAFEIREELANRYNLEIRNVCCYHCKYWGFNCGKVLNS